MFKFDHIVQLRKLANYEADKNYEAQMETNNANKEIAESLNNTNLQISRETNYANQNLAAQQNQWNIDQWNRENAYNSPKNQVKRLLDAGINPSLVGGVGNTGNSSHLESSELANQSPAHLDALARMENPQAHASELRIAKQNQITQSLRAFGDSVEQMARVKQAQYSMLESEARMRQIDSQISLAEGISPLQNALLESQKGLTDAQKHNVNVMSNRALRLLSGEIKEKELNIAGTELTNARKKLENEVYSAQIPALKGREDLNNKMIRANLAHIGKQLLLTDKQIEGQSLANAASYEDLQWLSKHNQAQLDKEILDARNAALDGNYKQWQENFRNRYGYEPSSNLWQLASYAPNMNGKRILNDLEFNSKELAPALIKSPILRSIVSHVNPLLR